MRVSLPIPLGFYQSESLPFAAQRCINFIPVVAENQALNANALMQPPGLKQIVDSGLGANRGAITADGIPYFINGNSLISVSSTGAVTNHGTISGSGQVSLAVNSKNVDTGSQFIVIVVPGGDAYAFATVTNVLTQITSVNFRLASQVVFKDGYFIFAAFDGSVFFVSNLNSPLTYDALDFGTAEVNPDIIVGLHVNHNELFVPGFDTVELQDNVAGDGFPFQRIDGANIQKGVRARFSMVEFDNTFCFVGGGLNELSAVWKVTGGSSATKISTDAIDKEIQKFTADEIKTSFALTFSRHGQFLALFTFESTRIPSRTFVYNATASALSGGKVWFEFQTGVTDNRFRVQSIVLAYGKLMVGDSLSGIIGEFDTDTLDYYGDEIYRQAVTAPFSQNGVNVFNGEFEAVFQAGVGLTGGVAPLVKLEVSDDGGHIFNDRASRSIGKIGEYGQRAIWRRQGDFPMARMVKLTITDKVKANLLTLAANSEAGY